MTALLSGMIPRALAALGRHAPPLLAASIFAGLAFPALAAWCRPALVPAVYALLAISLVRLDWRAVARYGRRPGPAVLAIPWLLLVSPLVMTAAVRVLPVPPWLATPLVLMSAAPPIISSVAFALLFGLDAALAVLTLVAALLLVPLTLPPLALRLLDLHIRIGLGDFMAQLALLVGGALAAAAIARRLLGEARIARHAAAIDGTAVLVLVVFAIGIMAGITARIQAEPGRVALVTAAAFLANLGLQLLSGLAFARLGPARALTVAMMSGNRNLAVLIAALAGNADFDTMMFFALGQLPIYILPAALAPLYRRLVPPADAASGAAGPG